MEEHGGTLFNMLSSRRSKTRAGIQLTSSGAETSRGPPLSAGAAKGLLVTTAVLRAAAAAPSAKVKLSTAGTAPPGRTGAERGAKAAAARAAVSPVKAAGSDVAPVATDGGSKSAAARCAHWMVASSSECSSPHTCIGRSASIPATAKHSLKQVRVASGRHIK